MIWISDDSLPLTFAAKKPVTSKDFKVFDDLDISCQFAKDICTENPVTSKDFKVFDDLDISCQFAIDICS